MTSTLCYFLDADKVARHRRIQHKNNHTDTKTKDPSALNKTHSSSSNSKNKSYSRSDGAKCIGQIDDRTITRRSKGSEECTRKKENEEEGRTQIPPYRAQSAKNRDTSRYQCKLIHT